MPYDPYARMNDPYSGQKSRGAAQMNGGKGAGTQASTMNAYQQQQPKGSDPYASFGNLSAAWSGTLGRKPVGMSAGSIPSYGTQPRQAGPDPAGRTVLYGDPRTGSTTTHNPSGGMVGQPNRFDYGYGPGVDPHFAPPGSMGLQPANLPPSVTYYDPKTGGTTTNPGFNPSGPSLPQGGGMIQRYNPLANPTADTNPYEEVRRTLQKPGTGMSAVPEGGYQNMREGAPPDQFGPSPFTPQQPSSPPARPPGTPSTQPVPNPRPPMTPSTQPVGGMIGTPERNPWEGAPAPPGSTTPFYGPRPGGGRYEDGPMVGSPLPGGYSTYFDPNTGGTTTHNPSGGLPNQFPVLPSGGREVGGMSPGVPSFSPPTPSGPGGQPLGSNGVGRRYGPGYGGTPIAAPGEQGAGGGAPTMYEWKDGKLTPVATPGSSAAGAPPPVVNVLPEGGAGTSTTTGQFAAPNNSTTFDPNVLPQSDVGEWLDPVFQDTMDKMTRQLRHEGSISGATNSGGFIPGIAEKLSPVANQFAAMKGDIGFKDQQAKADRLLDKYKFDNEQQLTAWIEKNQQELQRYGIDQNVLLGRYSADQGLAGASAGASASMYGADAAANASRNNAWLDYMQGMSGIGANYGLGQDRLGYDYYNSNQNYGLGQQQLGYNYWNSDQGRQYENTYNQRGYDLGMTGINRDVYGMDQAQQRYLMELMWKMSPGGQMGGGYFPTSGVFSYGG